MPQQKELRLLDQESIARSTIETKRFYRDTNGDWLMWFRGRAVVINEGVTTARVRVNGEHRWIESTEGAEFDGKYVAKPNPVNSLDRQEYLIRPGQAAMFEWGAGHKIRTWIDLSDKLQSAEILVSIDVASFVNNGIVDEIKFIVGARPFIAGSGGANDWILVTIGLIS
jgi:hypothetical protein